MDYDGLHRDFRHAGYFATEAQQHLAAALKAAIKQGQLIAVSGIVSSGKTTLLHQGQAELVREKEVLVARSLAVEKDRVELRTVIMALFYDLATEKDVKIPTHPETRERQVLDLISKRRKPIALFIDDAHALPGKTRTELKRLLALVYQPGERLAIILAGHPKLQHELRRPAMEEIGARPRVCTLAGIKGYQHDSIGWLLAQCTDAPSETILTPEAVDALAASLATPLQVEQYLTLALEAAYRAGQKPVTPEIITSGLATSLDALEPTLARHGYNTRAVAALLHVRHAEIRAFLRGRLPAGRVQELQQELRAAGLPL
jgi:type II secretory pathway predicted ATPase ExeA